MNRLEELFKTKNKNILSVYFTAGFPALNDTEIICSALEEAGVDLIEVGVPFSDPVADGETIQKSNEVALANGMNLKLLLSQLRKIRETSKLPIILMGYANPFMQYGIEKLATVCSELSIDGTIIPDLPLDLYLDKYKSTFEANNLINVCLITPQTTEQRIRFIDDNSKGFIYAVSSAAVTGGSIDLDGRAEYLKRLELMNLKNPILVGFGISNKSDISEISKYASGSIIGSAFIREISKSTDLKASIKKYIGSLS